ncbi:MAG TPA: hypothetical protein VNI61_04210, partial [Gemmatimonadales bacterium]|nr:hypothetical protein [Gemmatimonadales bacterium]
MTRAVASVLEPAGYDVVTAASGEAALERVRASPPDVVLFVGAAAQAQSAALVHSLRRAPGVGPETALLAVAPAGASRAERLAWLRAGAWDCFSFPFDPEELLLKLATHVRVKREAERARGAALVDESTGLYTPAGVRRRAAEFLAEAERLGMPVACVLIGVGPAGAPAIRDRVAGALRAHGRRSDAIGWW